MTPLLCRVQMLTWKRLTFKRKIKEVMLIWTPILIPREIDRLTNKMSKEQLVVVLLAKELRATCLIWVQQTSTLSMSPLLRTQTRKASTRLMKNTKNLNS